MNEKTIFPIDKRLKLGGVENPARESIVKEILNKGWMIKKFKGGENLKDMGIDLPENPVEIANGLKSLYELIKEYYSKHIEIAETHFFVSDTPILKSQQEKTSTPSVYIFQKKVEGYHPDIGQSNDLREFVNEIAPKVWKDLKEDSRWNNLPQWLKDKYEKRRIDLIQSNFIVTPDKFSKKLTTTLIDW